MCRQSFAVHACGCWSYFEKPDICPDARHLYPNYSFQKCIRISAPHLRFASFGYRDRETGDLIGIVGYEVQKDARPLDLHCRELQMRYSYPMENCRLHTHYQDLMQISQTCLPRTGRQPRQHEDFADPVWLLRYFDVIEHRCDEDEIEFLVHEIQGDVRELWVRLDFDNVPSEWIRAVDMWHKVQACESIYSRYWPTQKEVILKRGHPSERSDKRESNTPQSYALPGIVSQVHSRDEPVLILEAPSLLAHIT